MACCMVGLLMIYQLIDAWQRCRQWVRQPLPWLPMRVAPMSIAPATPRRRMRGRLLLALFVFQVGFGTTFAFTHRSLLSEDISSIVSAAQSMCRTVGVTSSLLSRNKIS